MLGFSAFQILETSPQVPCTSGVPDQCCLWDIHVANYFPYPLAYRFIAIYFFRRYEDTHLKRFVKPCWSQPWLNGSVVTFVVLEVCVCCLSLHTHARQAAEGQFPFLQVGCSSRVGGGFSGVWSVKKKCYLYWRHLCFKRRNHSFTGVSEEEKALVNFQRKLAWKMKKIPLKVKDVFNF